MKNLIKTSCGLTLLALLSGCGSSEGGFTGSDATSGTNIIWDFNFSSGAEETQLDIIELPAGTLATTPTLDFFTGIVGTTHGGVTTKISVLVGDRLNAKVTSGTIHFAVQYGLIDAPTCNLNNTGSCSVTWTSITNLANLIFEDSNPLVFDSSTNWGIDLKNSYTTWTYGEESFSDTNGNGYYDNGETFYDIDEPFVDTNDNLIYDLGEPIIDVNNDLQHNPGDGLYNGSNCLHSTLCSNTTSIPIYYLNHIFLGVDAS